MTVVLLLIIGFIVGMVVISMGGGGAAIYLGLLSSVFDLSPSAAAATSLITVVPSLLLGAYGYYREGQINIKIGNQMLLTALPAVIVGSLVSPYIPQTIYQWIIGIILVVLGINILVQAHKKAKTVPRDNRLIASLFGALAGLMVGIAGLSGGGPIMAGLLMMGLSMLNAAATSSYVLVGMTIIGAAFHTVGGQVDWGVGLGLMIGALGGALIAPRLLGKVGTKRTNRYLKPLMGILLVVMGIKSLL